MIRFVLTLLAFVTGLSAIGPTAEARVCGLGSAEIGAVETIASGDRVAARTQGPSAPKARREIALRQPGCAHSGRRPVYIPTVQLGPDRARE